MKIGIVTYYNAINEGAFLQAYCLKNFIEKQFSCEVYFVPNKRIDIFNIQKKQLLHSKNPKVLWVNWVRIASNQSARKRFLPVGIGNQKYDVVIVGSDEMWNEKNKAFTEYNTAFGIEAPIKISYAVSMGNYVSRLSEGVINEISKFSTLSVRDLNSQMILNKSMFKNGSIHLDPVFLYKIVSEEPKIAFGFILIYGAISNAETVKKIKEYSKNKKLKTISVDIYNSWCDVKTAARSPFEFVGYIDKADLIITNMFHGAMLSVVRNKSFISLQTERRKQKIEFASKKLLFDKRCINEQDDWCIEDILDNELDFESINEIIEQEQNNVKTYFMKAFQT